jgi:hypothetical protein
MWLKFRRQGRHFRDYTEPKGARIRGRITKAFDDDAPRIVAGIQESGQARIQVVVRADGITAKGSRKQFWEASAPLERNALNSTGDQVFAGRCRAEYNQLSDRLGSLPTIELSRAFNGGIRAQVTHRIDAHFSVFALAITTWIGVNVEFGSEITDLQLAKCHVPVLTAEQPKN